MAIAYRAITILLAVMAFSSGVAKVRRDPKVVRVVHEIVGVPMKYFALLAACEIAGALGLLLGMSWAPLGVAGGFGLFLYFWGAILSHLRVGDGKGVGPAAFLMVLSAAAVVLRILVSVA
jgi:hypothetical protein